ncbi:MAG: tetratricopeptide repeat protein [Bacteroidia bacterium]
MAKQKNEASSKNKSGRKTVADTEKLSRTLAWLLAVFAFLLYFNTLSHEYVLDDYSVIKENQITQQGIGAVPKIFFSSYREGSLGADASLYRPLSKAMFAIEWSMAADSPGLSHFINVLFYALTIFLLFRVLYLFTGQLLFSFLITALFAAHPIHTEVVANIKSRDEIMGLFFFVLSLKFLYTYLSEGHKLSVYFAGGMYLLSLFSKESAITFLAVVPAVMYFFSKAEKKDYVRVLSIFVGAATIFFLFRLTVIGFRATDSATITENILVGAPNIGIRYATAIYLLGLYVWRMVWPDPLSSDHSFAEIQLLESVGDWRFLVSLVVFGAMIFYAVRFYKRKDLLAFAIVFFVVTISIVSNLVTLIGTNFAERLLFVPSLAFSIACVALFAKLGVMMKREVSEETQVASFFSRNGFFVWPVVLVCVLYSWKTIARNADWESNFTLHTADVKNAPNSARAHFYLGNYVSLDNFLQTKSKEEQKKYNDLAITELEQSLKIYPKFPEALGQLARVYMRNGANEKSEMYFKKAIEVAPNVSLYRSNYGTLLFGQKRMAEAQDQFEKAVKFNPYFTDAYFNLGAIHGEAGRHDQAIAYFQKAIALKPDYAEAYYYIGITYDFKGDKATGSAYKAKAAQLNPAKFKK